MKLTRLEGFRQKVYKYLSGFTSINRFWRWIKAKNLSKEAQTEFCANYIQESLDGIEYVSNVPKVVYVAWFSGYKQETPLMSVNRFLAFQSLVESINIPVILITKDSFKSFEKEKYPFHPAFEYLSGNHKSDYMRIYMLHHYGGAYHDIKHRSLSWETAWNDDNWIQDDQLWMYGIREKYESWIGYPPGMEHIKKSFRDLVTMGFIICKPNTPYTTTLLKSIESTLDFHHQQLQEYPGSSAGHYAKTPFSMAPENSYPLRWLEVMGEHSHPLMLKYKEHIKFGLPDIEYLPYKDNS